MRKRSSVCGSVFPTLHSWTWPGQEGKPLEVEVYSGAEKVQLFLNDKLIGEKPTGRAQEFKAVFAVPYAPGVLKAVGLRGDRVVAALQHGCFGTGDPTRLQVFRPQSCVFCPLCSPPSPPTPASAA